ncbi:hypothetical protein E4U55_000072 [Claviceps digitariae]|nr:hypothetical protein E4U55_000072 [Claviceps digitariae]
MSGLFRGGDNSSLANYDLVRVSEIERFVERIDAENYLEQTSESIQSDRTHGPVDIVDWTTSYSDLVKLHIPC